VPGRRWTALVVASALVAVTPGAVAQAKPSVTIERYDGASGGEVQTEADYLSKWVDDGFGVLPATRTFSSAGVKVSSVPFVSAADFSVFDHLKYIATATKVWPVPAAGSVTFGTTLTTRTDGIVPGLVQHGTYVQSGAAYEAPLLNVQQASTSLNVVDFCTGMVFDWLVTGTTAAPLIERLPSNVTGNTSNPNCPGAKHVGRELMYTQYVREVPISEGVPHRFEITYNRAEDGAYVEYILDGRRVAKVDQVGIPLDRRGMQYTGTYPSLGPGELVDSQIATLGMAHGLFSVLDAFPFQHPEAPELSVSIPAGPGAPGFARLWGQGSEGTWHDFTITTVSR
jgi:Family of unknown function (DUF6081)